LVLDVPCPELDQNQKQKIKPKINSNVFYSNKNSPDNSCWDFFITFIL